MRNKTPGDIVSHIESLRGEMLSDKRIIKVTDLGAGSLKMKGAERRVADIARLAALPGRDAGLLARIAASLGQGAWAGERGECSKELGAWSMGYGAWGTGQTGGSNQEGSRDIGQTGGSKQEGSRDIGQTGGSKQEGSRDIGQTGGSKQEGSRDIGQAEGSRQEGLWGTRHGVQHTGHESGETRRGDIMIDQKAWGTGQTGGSKQEGSWGTGQTSGSKQGGLRVTGQAEGSRQEGSRDIGQTGGSKQEGSWGTGQTGGSKQEGSWGTGQTSGSNQGGLRGTGQAEGSRQESTRRGIQHTGNEPAELRRSDIMIDQEATTHQNPEGVTPGIFLELGTSLGISTLAMALAAPGRRVVTVEGCPELAEIAKSNLKRHGTPDVSVMNMEFTSALEILKADGTKVSFAFIDGNHRGEALLNYIRRILLMGDEMIIVADDIHLNSEMYRSWKMISESGVAEASLETNRFGILFRRNSLTPGRYRIWH